MTVLRVADGPLGLTPEELAHEGFVAFLEAAPRARFPQLAYERARWAMRDAVRRAIACGLTGADVHVRAAAGRVRALLHGDAMAPRERDDTTADVESYAVAAAVLARHLTPRVAELCRAIWLDDESVECMAERQGRSPQHVRVSLSHARARLRARLAA